MGANDSLLWNFFTERLFRTPQKFVLITKKETQVSSAEGYLKQMGQMRRYLKVQKKKKAS